LTRAEQTIAVILGEKKELKDCVKPCFTTEYYGKTYAGTIIHPYNIDLTAPLQFLPGLQASESDDESEESQRLRKHFLPAQSVHLEGPKSIVFEPGKKRPKLNLFEFRNARAAGSGGTLRGHAGRPSTRSSRDHAISRI